MLAQESNKGVTIEDIQKIFVVAIVAILNLLLWFVILPRLASKKKTKDDIYIQYLKNEIQLDEARKHCYKFDTSSNRKKSDCLLTALTPVANAKSIIDVDSWPTIKDQLLEQKSGESESVIIFAFDITHQLLATQRVLKHISDGIQITFLVPQTEAVKSEELAKSQVMKLFTNEQQKVAAKKISITMIKEGATEAVFENLVKSTIDAAAILCDNGYVALSYNEKFFEAPKDYIVPFCKKLGLLQSDILTEQHI